MTILVVDDEPALGRLYGAAIGRRGFDVLLASSAEQALETVRQKKIRLILTDVEMPEIGGHELSRRLHKKGRVPCPLLFLSAHDSVELMAEGLRAGGDDFLTKGGAVEETMERIVFWLTSGFRRLPLPARLRAIEALEKLDPSRPVLGDIRFNQKALARAFEQLWREVQATPSGYGERLVDRIRILGRASALVTAQSKSAADCLRFPDALLRMILRLRMPWSADIGALLAHYELLARDPRFREAGEKGLVAIGSGPDKGG